MPRPGFGGPRHRDFLIDGLMPKREVHLLGGASGVGKTTLILPMLDKLAKGQEVFGHKCRPTGTTIFCVDRSEDAYTRTMERLGLNPDDFQYHSLVNPRFKGWTAEKCLDFSRNEYPLNQCIFFEAIMGLLPKGGGLNDFHAVAMFLTEIRTSAADLGLTVIGSCHLSKVKQNEKIMDPRQRVIGSVAWAAFADCIVMVDHEDSEKPDNPNRIVSLLPRDYPNHEFQMHFSSDGRLVDGAAPLGTQVISDFLTALKSMEDGTSVSRAVLEKLIEDFGISKSRGMKHKLIEEAKGLGTLRYEKYNTYKIIHSPVVF